MLHNIKECLVDLTGGVAKEIDMEQFFKANNNKEEKLWELLLHNFKNKIFYIGCENLHSPLPQIYQDAPAGILPNHAYGVIDVQDVNIP